MLIDDIYPPTLAIREYPVDDSALANDTWYLIGPIR